MKKRAQRFLLIGMLAGMVAGALAGWFMGETADDWFGWMGQFFLRHFIVVKAQSSYSVLYPGTNHLCSFSSNQPGYRGIERSY